jgi:hypothetical protein
MVVRIAGRAYTVDWGHLMVATLIVGSCIVYLIDARSTSLKTQNLILVQPATILAVVLYLLILPQCIRRVTGTPAEVSVQTEKAASTPRITKAELLRVASLAAAFGFFVFSMEILGFDVGAWIFITIGLIICGEKRLLILALFPPVITVLLVLGYKQLLPYPIHTLIL